MADVLIDVGAFDALPAEAATELLRPACASSAWQRAMVAGRPYFSLAELTACSDGIVGALGWSDIEEALAAHPRIGERAAGDEREAAWSRQEQSAVTGEDALRAGNTAYEERFGHVFLICATGRAADEVLAELTKRLDNDIATEQEVVRTELADIVRLRLAKALR